MITRVTVPSRQYTFNLGDYCSIKIGGYSIEVARTKDQTGEQFAAEIKQATAYIDGLVNDEIEQAIVTIKDKSIDKLKQMFAGR